VPEVVGRSQLGLVLGALLLFGLLAVELAMGWVNVTGSFAPSPGQPFIPTILVGVVAAAAVALGEEGLSVVRRRLQRSLLVALCPRTDCSPHQLISRTPDATASCRLEGCHQRPSLLSECGPFKTNVPGSAPVRGPAETV
jgi:hypothetical protein